MNTQAESGRWFVILFRCEDQGFINVWTENSWRIRGFHALRGLKAMLESPVMFPMHNCNQLAVWVMRHRSFYMETVTESLF